MELIDVQKKAVDKLVTAYENAKKGGQKTVIFSAPTGSGKTFMAANFIAEILKDRNIKKTMVVIATVSRAELPRAFKRKLEEYKKFLKFRDFSVEFRDAPSKVKKGATISTSTRGFKLVNKKVLIFGTSSFGKGKIFTEGAILEKFINNAKQGKWKIIYIRDEAHIGAYGERDEKKALKKYEKGYLKFEPEMSKLAAFNIQMTATPKVSQKSKKIIISEKEIGKKLLKKKCVINHFTKNTSDWYSLVTETITKFKEIQAQYKKLKLNNVWLRPAMLVQVDSVSKKKRKEHDKMINKLIGIFKKEGLKYLKYFSDSKESNLQEEATLKAASRPDSLYDVIIFKVGPAIGWDIPRACMLLQLRNISSEILKIQTIGRIRRNPMPNLDINPITNKYYIYTNHPTSENWHANYKLKKKFVNNISLFQGKIIMDEKSKVYLEDNYKKKVKDCLSTSAFIDRIKNLSISDKLKIYEDRYDNKFGTENIVPQYLLTIFDFKLWLLKKLKENSVYFTDSLNGFLKEVSKKNNVAIEIIQYTIITYYLQELKKHYLNSFEIIRKNISYKLSKTTNIVQKYQTWITEQRKKNTHNTSKLTNYGYTLIRNSKGRDIQYLDSFPERAVLRKMDELSEEDYWNDVIFFSKMPTHPSEIYFEYMLNDSIAKHKAYIDFAIVSKDRVLMMEVKGEKDIDKNKTDTLLSVFQKYKKDNLNANIDFCICYVEKSDWPKFKVIYLKNNDGKKETITFRKMLKEFLRK